MSTLRVLIRSHDPIASDAPVTRLGGLPSGTDATGWPVCMGCERPMRALAQVRLQDVDPTLPPGFALAFGCGRDDGPRCVEPDVSGNRAAVLAIGARCVPMTPPEPELVAAPVGLEVLELEVPDDPDPADAEREEFSHARRSIAGALGKLGGVPFWLSWWGNAAAAYSFVEGVQGSVDAPYCRCQLTKKRVPKRGARPMSLLMQVGGLAVESWSASYAYLLRCPVCGEARLELDMF